MADLFCPECRCRVYEEPCEHCGNDYLLEFEAP